MMSDDECNSDNYEDLMDSGNEHKSEYIYMSSVEEESLHEEILASILFCINYKYYQL